MKQASGGFEFGSLCLAGYLRVAGFWHALRECADGRATIHAAPLMGPLGVVALEVFIEHRLHFLIGLKPGAPPLDPEMLVEQRAVETFKDAVGLRAPDALRGRGYRHGRPARAAACHRRLGNI